MGSGLLENTDVIEDESHATNVIAAVAVTPKPKKPLRDTTRPLRGATLRADWADCAGSCCGESCEGIINHSILLCIETLHPARHTLELALMAFPTKEQVHAIVEPVVGEFTLLVEEIKISKAGAKSAVRIAVDAATPTRDVPDLDELEEVSKALSEELDRAEDNGIVNFGPGYTLEVTTPGVDFPMTQHRHWRKNIGRLVKLPGGKKARVAQVSDDAVALVTSKKKNTIVTIHPLGEVAGSVVDIEFSTPPQRETDLVGLEWAAYEAITD